MKALVTGGGGFLGGGIIRRLIERGDTVRSFTRTAYPWLKEAGVEQINGSLNDANVVAQACQGCDVVFHVAAKAGVWGRYADFYATNFTGTENVIAGCRKHGVTRLVYTSTPSVVHGGESLAGIDESVPYPKQFEAAYPETKALAEQAVIAANDTALSTVSLRPHLIWGPGDPHLIPRVLARAKAHKLRRVGTEPVMVDVTYIDNVVDAHILAADKLQLGSALAGKAYFITNDEPVELWEFLNKILVLAKLPPVTKVVPLWKAKLAGQLMERIYKWLRLPGEPRLTRFVVSQLSTSHWYNISAAKRDLGYHPRISIEEGLKRLAATL
jgi:2-alkyl-3-oxoalkanoate reductase